MELIDLTRRERFILETLVSAHREFGADKAFTATAVELLADGPCAGSLGILTAKGLATRAQTPDGYAYAATDLGRRTAMPRG